MPTPPLLVKRVQLLPMQHAFRHSEARRRGFCGGRGAGKSWIGVYDLICRAQSPDGRNRLYMAGNATYGQLNDTTLRSFREVAQLLGVWDARRYRGSPTPSYRLPGGSEVLFRSAEDPERFRGPNLSGILLDEASLISRAAYLVGIACLREGGRAGWLSATFTPRGKDHWTYDVFGRGGEGTELFQSATTGNVFLPATFEADLRGQYTASFAAQELGGEFIDAPGLMFDAGRVRVVEAVPRAAQRVRAWDKAGVQGGGDYTAGVLVARHEGVYYVEHVVRGQYSSLKRNEVILQTAQVDAARGPAGVPIWVEQEGGSGGKESAEISLRELAGFIVRAERSTGEKATRAMPLAAQVEAGNVCVVRGDWNAAFLDELSSFPTGTHDDQVDAASMAFNKIALNPPSFAPVTAPRGTRVIDSLPADTYG